MSGDVDPGEDESVPAAGVEAVASPVVSALVFGCEVSDVSVDLDSELDHWVGEVKPVFAVRPGGDLDRRNG